MFQDHYLDSSTLDHIQNVRSQNKGITQCDLGYIASFDPEDYHKLYKYYQYIKLARQLNDLETKNELINYFEQFLARKYQDKTVCYEHIPEPHKVGFQADRVVFSGLER